MLFAQELKPDSPEILFHLAQCKFHLGKNAEASGLLTAVLAQRPHFSQALYLQALLRYGEGEREEAIRLLRRALSENPHLNDGELDLAIMYMHQGEWSSAEELLARLTGQNVHSAELHCFVGQVRLSRGSVKEARGDFERALELEEGNLYALKGRLHCELKLGRFGEARDLLAPYLLRYPDYPDLRKIQGDIQFQIGDYQTAEREYREALALAPHYLAAKLGLALALRNQARSEEAAELLRELTAAHPDNLRLRRLLNERFLDLEEGG